MRRIHAIASTIRPGDSVEVWHAAYTVTECANRDGVLWLTLKGILHPCTVTLPVWPQSEIPTLRVLEPTT